MWNWLDSLLYGPRPSAPSSAQIVAIPPPQPTLRTSHVFDTHVITEASGGGGKGKLPQSVSLAWGENPWSSEVQARDWTGLTHRERKETLLQIFLANPWASNCIDTIALYITSGGFTLMPRPGVEKPDQRQHDEIQEFLLRINEGWDFNQYVYDMLTDDMIFGEAFTEFTLQGGKPYQLFSIDCLTMDTEHDRYGRVTRYKQQLNLTDQVNYLDPKTIIRWWNPHKRAKVDPFSPLERIQDAILLDKKMVNWTTTFFQKGAKFPYYVKFPGDRDEADRYLTWFKQNYTGEKNAHLPPVAYNGAEFVPMGKGAIDIDFDSGLDRQQVIVLSAFHVPPSIACIAESGNRLTDMSDGQRKILEYVACDPRRHRFFEKFNNRLIQPYWPDWYVSSRYADFRSDSELAKTQDMRIRNGSVTINETRQEMGKDAYKKGGDVALFAVSKEVTPVERLDEMADEQRQTAQQALDAADLNNELLQEKVKQAKEPPQPVPAALQTAQQGVASFSTGKQQNGKNPPENAQKPPKSGNNAAKSDASRESWQPRLSRQPRNAEELMQDFERLIAYAKTDPDHSDYHQTEEGASQHTGMMLAFLLDGPTAAQLAIPGGEPADDLHITLAYLGDMEEQPEDDLLRPHTSPEKIREAIELVAADSKPIAGRITGLGRFTPAETDEDPIIALVDVPGLVELRTMLVEFIEAAGYFIANDHGYTPHITLAYIPQDAPMPIESVPALPLDLNTVWLCVGEERIPFRLGGDATQPAQESAADLEPLMDYFPELGVRQTVDVYSRVEALQAKGVKKLKWKTYPGACEQCEQNDGETREVGQAFPNGALLPRCHEHCECEVEEIME